MPLARQQQYVRENHSLFTRFKNAVRRVGRATVIIIGEIPTDVVGSPHNRWRSHEWNQQRRAAERSAQRDIVNSRTALGHLLLIPTAWPSGENVRQSILEQAKEIGVITQEEIDVVDDRYICYITQQVMEEPVFDTKNEGEQHGSRFDRKAVESWIRHKGENPETRRRILPVENLDKTFKEDTQLSKEIEEFMQDLMRRMTLDRPSGP